MTGQPAFEIPTQHPAFKIPTNQDIKIWRYMDFAKYVAILQRRSLFFPRASLLGDPFEGSSTKPMVELREYIMKNRTIDPTLKEYEYLTDAYFSGDIYKNMVDQYLVSCWHMNEKAHPAVPGRSICSMKVPCAGDQRRAGGTWGGSGAIAERVSDELSGRDELRGVLV